MRGRSDPEEASGHGCVHQIFLTVAENETKRLAFPAICMKIDTRAEVGQVFNERVSKAETVHGLAIERPIISPLETRLKKHEYNTCTPDTRWSTCLIHLFFHTIRHCAVSSIPSVRSSLVS